MHYFVVDDELAIRRCHELLRNKSGTFCTKEYWICPAKLFFLGDVIVLSISSKSDEALSTPPAPSLVVQVPWGGLAEGLTKETAFCAGLITMIENKAKINKVKKWWMPLVLDTHEENNQSIVVSLRTRVNDPANLSRLQLAIRVNWGIQRDANLWGDSCCPAWHDPPHWTGELLQINPEPIP